MYDIDDANATGTTGSCLCVALRPLVRCILMELRGPVVVWRDIEAHVVTGRYVSLSLSVSISLCLSLSVCLSICLFFCLPVPVHLSVVFQVNADVPLQFCLQNAKLRIET